MAVAAVLGIGVQLITGNEIAIRGAISAFAVYLFLLPTWYFAKTIRADMATVPSLRAFANVAIYGGLWVLVGHLVWFTICEMLYLPSLRPARSLRASGTAKLGALLFLLGMTLALWTSGVSALLQHSSDGKRARVAADISILLIVGLALVYLDYILVRSL